MAVSPSATSGLPYNQRPPGLRQSSSHTSRYGYASTHTAKLLAASCQPFVLVRRRTPREVNPSSVHTAAHPPSPSQRRTIACSVLLSSSATHRHHLLPHPPSSSRSPTIVSPLPFSAPASLRPSTTHPCPTVQACREGRRCILSYSVAERPVSPRWSRVGITTLIVHRQVSDAAQEVQRSSIVGLCCSSVSRPRTSRRAHRVSCCCSSATSIRGARQPSTHHSARH